MGTIELGMMADMIFLDANPVQKIQNTTAIRTVFKAGKLFNRKALNQRLIAD
jgi:imidazolonepropionase-like amidohydrolase